MPNTSEFVPSITDTEYNAMLRNFDRKALVNLATDKATMPYLARAKLRDDLLLMLDDVGVPSAGDFYKALGTHNAVLSGSFVACYLDPDFSATWPAPVFGPRDVDMYVGKGKLDDMLSAISQLSGGTMQMVSRSEAPTPTLDKDGEVLIGPVHSRFYNNAAIGAMARIRIRVPGKRSCYMDVMESKSKSALMPIVRFNLTHLRAAISFEGILDLHPEWNHDRKTYASPRVKRSQAVDIDEDFVSPVEKFYSKYRNRGYEVVEGDLVDDTEPHVCRESTCCPLTLRSTVDLGVRFTPITEEAAIRLCHGPPQLLADPIVYWTHGGKCMYSGDETVDPVVYDSEGVSGDHMPAAVET
ncbi:hypothetical protein SCHPADRAFT_895663 [Schizopora paradoxa]|uniref:Uncharacterized protein n=1 Tax=Schizopora paradoxa TaxID=27342 RepID=A0A0H2R2Z8_9AGAM|nr:hypothetical protein SCHPADRAFT_895663 [Schizopora paradoxa]